MTPCPRGRAAQLAAAALGVWVLSLTLLPAGAWAQSGEGHPAGSLDLQLSALEAVVGHEGTLRARLRIVNRSRQDREDLRVLATLHRQTRARWEYQSAVDEGRVGNLIDGVGLDLGAVPAKGARTVELERSVTELGLGRLPGRAGVYPLRFQLLADGEVVDEIVTSMVVVPDDVDEPLRVALLLSVTAPPSRRGDGTYGAHGVVSMAARPTGDLHDTVAAVAARPEVPVTLAIDPLAIEEVADLSDGFELVADGQRAVFAAESGPARSSAAFGAAITEASRADAVEHFALPHSSVDLVALVRAGLETEAQRQVTDSVREVEHWTGSRPVEGFLWPPDGIDEATLARMRAVQAELLVLSEDYLRIDRGGADFTPGPVRRVRAGTGTSIDALVPDPWLERTLDDLPDDIPLAAQRIVGEIASVYFEQPGERGRSLLLAAPYGRTLPAGLAAELLTTLDAAPVTRPVAISQLTGPTDPPEARLAYPEAARARELPSEYVDALATARRRLGSLEGVLVDDVQTPARFDRLLLQAASVHYRGHRGREGHELIDTVGGTIEQLYSSVSVPDSPPITLTALEGPVPVTLHSTADVPLRVLLTLSGPRFAVEDGATREVILEPSSTEVVTVQVRALTPGGTGPLQVRITDVDGVLTLATGTVVLRSTAFSTVALAVTTGAAIFLLAWWARGRARRQRELAPPATREPTTVG